MGVFANASQQNTGQAAGGGGIFARKAQEQNQAQENPGFFKGLARDIVKPFARLGTNLVNAGQIALGKETTQPFSGNFLGEVKPVGQEGTFGEKLKDTFGVGLQAASNIPVAKGAGLTFNALKTAVKSKALLPTLGDAAIPLVKEGVLGGTSYGTGKALEEQQSAGGVLKSGALGALVGGVTAPVLGLGIPLAARGIRNIPKIPSAVKPDPVNIMNRVARLTPTDAQKFQKLAGKSHGQYLQDTGNFGNPQEIIENEAKKFANSINEVDTELAKLPGVHKSKELDTVLEDLVKREAEIGVPGGDSSKIITLYNKNKLQNGLSMEDSNWVKRKYERDIKLGYQKENNTIGVARATRLDNALREWQFKTASNLGLKNLDELNKQTQLSRFIVDKLGKQLSGKTGNEAINLTDWIILSGGDPTAITAFLGKKLLLNKSVMAGLAKTLTKKPGTPPIKAKMGGKTGLPALIPGRDYSLPKPNNPKYKPIPLPKSVREINLGLDEIKNTTRVQTNRKKKPQLKLQVKPKGKS